MGDVFFIIGTALAAHLQNSQRMRQFILTADELEAVVLERIVNLLV